jgi:hypothetical protein
LLRWSDRNSSRHFRPAGSGRQTRILIHLLGVPVAGELRSSGQPGAGCPHIDRSCSLGSRNEGLSGSRIDRVASSRVWFAVRRPHRG